MVRFIQVSTTVDNRRVAAKIAKILLQKRLSSCVQIIGPITSNYWWNGKTELAKESLCLIKARSHDYPEIESAIQKIHPYEVPEIFAVPILRGNPDYLRWIRKETSPTLRRRVKLSPPRKEIRVG